MVTPHPVTFSWLPVNNKSNPAQDPYQPLLIAFFPGRAAMSNKGKPSVREAEIEKCREEANWRRIIELAEQVKQRTPASGETGVSRACNVQPQPSLGGRGTALFSVGIYSDIDIHKT